MGDTYDTGLFDTRAFFAGTVADLVASACIDLNLASRTEPVDSPDDFTTLAEQKERHQSRLPGRKDVSDAVPPTRTLGISTKTPERPRFSARAQGSVWPSGSLIALR